MFHCLLGKCGGNTARRPVVCSTAIQLPELDKRPAPRDSSGSVAPGRRDGGFHHGADQTSKRLLICQFRRHQCRATERRRVTVWRSSSGTSRTRESSSVSLPETPETSSHPPPPAPPPRFPDIFNCLLALLSPLARCVLAPCAKRAQTTQPYLN